MLIQEAQDRFFKSIDRNINHCLHFLLPEETNTGYNLRQPGHKYQLPTVTTALFKKSYLINRLYNTSN